MDNPSNRTFVSSVLFLDIAEYAKRSVTEQMKLKQRFNTLLIQALQQVAANDRIVLDTVDGAAVCFLGSPDVAMFVAMHMRDGIGGESPGESPSLEVRMGINLGPIRLIKDSNGQLNIIGDGINVAQRVMSFATAGTILVSRAFFEVVSRLSGDYARILQYEGSRTDKQIREHEVYAVGTTDAHSPGGDPAADENVAVAGNPAEPAPGLNKKMLAGVSLLAFAIVGAAILLRGEPAVDGEASDIPPPSIVEAETEPSLAAPVVAPPPPPPPKTGKTEATAPPKVATAARKTVPPKAVQANATALLLIMPWGEVYVDGQKRGISPPLKSLSLTPGMHKVEIRNSSLPPHLEKIDVKPGEKIKIEYTF